MAIRGRRFDNNAPVEIQVNAGRIAAISPIADSPELPWVSPGWLDIQVNGYGGHEFASANLAEPQVGEVSRAMDRMGVTRYWPTITTHSAEVICHALAQIHSACANDPEVAQRVGGIHLEGPYLSNQDGPRGAHPKEHCRAPDWEEWCRFQESAQGLVNLLTIAPEWPGASQFIAQVVESGVTVAIGHTAADSAQIKAAVDAGATLSTHLGNGAHGTIRRHPNYIWDQLAEDRLTASLIADGHHLPSAVLKTMVRAKTPDRCILVSDITGMAGMPPGRYESPSLAAVEVLENGRLVVAGQRQYLAGAALPLGVGIQTIVTETDASLREAVDMVTRNPARLLKTTAPITLEVGNSADLTVFRFNESTGERLEIVATYHNGLCSWQSD